MLMGHSDYIKIVRGVPSGVVSPKSSSLITILNILVPMRDGVCLAMDLLRPKEKKRFPVILTRTPYDKNRFRELSDIESFARRGYIVAMQDVRGRFNSDGFFEPYRQENNDGFDTVEWISKQGWCDGNVGMIGDSYGGQTQWYAASKAPAALKAIVPRVSPPGNPFLNEPFYGGVMILAMAEWMVSMGRRSFDRNEFASILSKHQEYFEAIPLSKLSEVAGTHIEWWEQWLNHPVMNAFWESCGYEQFWNKMKVPALNITGWWDMNFVGAPRNFVGMGKEAATLEAKRGQRLVIGPWPHLTNNSRTLNGLDFGVDAVTGIHDYTVRFFDRWLKDKKCNNLDDDSRVHVFVVGANEWWASDSWPLPGTQSTPLYLHSQGRANSHDGNGTIDFEAPENEPDDSFISDPMDPVRFPWSMHDGPVDDRLASIRSDVLCYTSDFFDEPIDVVGDISAVLYAASSAKDCDWHIRLIDVYPDGTARFMCHGALRSRFRKGFEKNVQLEPGEVTRFDINMSAIGLRLLPGHRIRIEIASSWFPRFDRNLQTGAENWMTDESEAFVARQIIKHTKNYPSHIVLPLIINPPSGDIGS